MRNLPLAILGAVAIAALAVVVAIQHQSLAKMREEAAAWQGQAAQAASLQAENERLSGLAAEAGNSALAKDQVRDLARLRAEVIRLHAQTNQMAALEAQNGELRRIVKRLDESRQLGAAAASQAGQTQVAREVMYQNACINNLRIIDSAKQQWALEQTKQITDTPSWEDLRPYFGRGPNNEPNDLPVCPSGGMYMIGVVGEKPQCSVPGHVLP